MSSMHRIGRTAWVVVLALFAVSCASAGKSARVANKPAPLHEITAEVSMRPIWSRNIGLAQDRYSRLRMIKAGDALYASNIHGHVFALNATDGAIIWKQHLLAVRAEKTRLSGGAGVSGDLLLYGDERGRLYALSRNTGELMWSKRLSAPIMAPASGSRGVVVARTADGKLHARSQTDGAELWVYSSILPLLTLRGYSAPLFKGDIVVAGLDNGRVVAVSLGTGDELWRARVARPSGDSVIEQLVDVDGELLLDNDLIYAVSYQGTISALDWRDGSLIWNDEASSYLGPAGGLGNVYVVDEQGMISAYEGRTGQFSWRQDKLVRRELGPPTAMGNYLVIGDRFGYVHLLGQLDGRLAGRIRHDRRGVRASAIAEDGVIYLMGNSGRIAAYSMDML